MAKTKKYKTQVTLKGGTFSLYRERDGAGDSGAMLQPNKWPTKYPATWDGFRNTGKNGQIIVGAAVRCGTFGARTMQYQDFWQTTPVTAILEVNADKTEVKFKTGNSIYIVKSR